MSIFPRWILSHRCCYSFLSFGLSGPNLPWWWVNFELLLHVILDLYEGLFPSVKEGSGVFVIEPRTTRALVDWNRHQCETHNFRFSKIWGFLSFSKQLQFSKKKQMDQWCCSHPCLQYYWYWFCFRVLRVIVLSDFSTWLRMNTP